MCWLQERLILIGGSWQTLVDAKIFDQSAQVPRGRQVYEMDDFNELHIAVLCTAAQYGGKAMRLCFT